VTSAVAWDTVAAIAIAALALAWIVRRAARTLSRRGGGCDCPSAGPEGGCGAAASAGDLKAAAARGAAKAGEKAARGG
jgi:hypothetical protein